MKNNRIRTLASSSLFALLLIVFGLSVSLPGRADWRTAPDWDGNPPFRKDYPQDPQFVAACRQGRLDVVQYWLKQQGFNPDHRFKSGKSSLLGFILPVRGLHLAIIHGHEDVVKALLDAGTSVHKTFGGLTPLYNAALWGRSQIVEMLLARGANPKKDIPFVLLTILPRTPLDAARTLYNRQRRCESSEHEPFPFEPEEYGDYLASAIHLVNAINISNGHNVPPIRPVQPAEPAEPAEPMECTPAKSPSPIPATMLRPVPHDKITY